MPGKLPPGAKAQFPAYDGDGFFVTLPPRPASIVSAGEVRDTVIAPLLNALGFSGTVSDLLLPVADGVPMPVASVRGLAEAALTDYEKTPGLFRAQTRRVFDAALGASPPDEALDAMLFAHEGRTFGQLAAHIERQEIQYPFVQAIDGSPIEGAAIIASRWAGQTVTTVFGTLKSCYATPGCFVVANRKARDAAGAISGALQLLLQRTPGARRVATREVLDAESLVLYPDGVDRAGRERLTFAYRTRARIRIDEIDTEFILWADAGEQPRVVHVEWLTKPFDRAGSVAAIGMVFQRDPGAGSMPAHFRVDSAESSRYTLKLTGLMSKLHVQTSTGQNVDVSIDASTAGSDSTFANFAQAPIDDVDYAPCAIGPHGGNVAFLQVNLFATLYRDVAAFVAGGMYGPFPEHPTEPVIDTRGVGCNAFSGLQFWSCPAYLDAHCPDTQIGLVSYADDNTVIGHELGHVATAALARSRPPRWCHPGTDGPACPVPSDWYLNFHDLADFWGAHLESTNCIGGWLGKNVSGTDASLYCRRHHEAGGFPRLLDPATDSFPDHRWLATSGEDYANGQVVGAALWAARLGMRSRSSVLGPWEFTVGLQRAIRNAGFVLTPASVPGTADHALYQAQQDLLRHLVDRWGSAPGGSAALAGKVIAGFASAGLFLVPHDCLGSYSVAPNCSGGRHGADAVIDVDDRDPTDDPAILGVVHPEHDFVRSTGRAPRFLVWTGPRYRLDGADGQSTSRSPAPCNAWYRVELALDPTFTTTVLSSGWRKVSRDARAKAACRASWVPGRLRWHALTALGPGTKVYYRVRTRSAAWNNERLSTRPANALWMIAPPFLVITATGSPDY